MFTSLVAVFAVKYRLDEERTSGSSSTGTGNVELTNDRLVSLWRQYAQDSREWDQQWLGVPVEQYAADLVNFQVLIWELKPDIVIETGTYYGGLSLYFSSLLEIVNPKARVVTVDVEDGWYNLTSRRDDGLERLKRRITFIHGSSTDPATIGQIRRIIKPGDRVLVVLDSLHEKYHVLKELQLYSEFVSKGSYLLCSDTHLDGTKWIKTREGPLAAVREFLQTNANYQIDRSLENHVVSAFFSGMLKRVN